MASSRRIIRRIIILNRPRISLHPITSHSLLELMTRVVRCRRQAQAKGSSFMVTLRIKQGTHLNTFSRSHHASSQLTNTNNCPTPSNRPAAKVQLKKKILPNRSRSTISSLPHSTFINRRQARGNVSDTTIRASFRVTRQRSTSQQFMQGYGSNLPNRHVSHFLSNYVSRKRNSVMILYVRLFDHQRHGSITRRRRRRATSHPGGEWVFLRS